LHSGSGSKSGSSSSTGGDNDWYGKPNLSCNEVNKVTSKFKCAICQCGCTRTRATAETMTVAVMHMTAND
jgi:hypothetical protein